MGNLGSFLVERRCLREIYLLIALESIYPRIAEVRMYVRCSSQKLVVQLQDLIGLFKVSLSVSIGEVLFFCSNLLKILPGVPI